MVDFDDAKTRARKELARAVEQYGFVRANWGKLSIIVIGAFVLGFVARSVLG